MRTNRRELKEQRLGRKYAAPGDEVRRRQFAEGRLSQVDSYYELLKMIAGAGMGLAGGGAGMLRTRRRDISIKPNRKLDRKSTRGMIYENEELRLRTIHINAEVEQGEFFYSDTSLFLYTWLPELLRLFAYHVSNLISQGRLIRARQCCFVTGYRFDIWIKIYKLITDLVICNLSFSIVTTVWICSGIN